MTWIYEETSQSSSRPLTLEASPKAKASRKRRGRRSPPPGDESSGIGERAEEETLTNDPSVDPSQEEAARVSKMPTTRPWT